MKTITLLFVVILCDVTQAQTVDEQCSTYQSQNQREGYAHASTDRQGYLRYAGCFDQGRTGMLHGRYFHSFNMTHEMCFSFCERWVYRFAGLRGGMWCTCDNSYNRRQHRRQPSFQCSTLCPGSEETSYQWCGGFRRVSLFVLRQRLKAEDDKLWNAIDELKIIVRGLLECGVPVRVHKANVEISVVEGSVTVNYACEGGLVPNGDVHHTTCSAGMWSDIGQLCVDVIVRGLLECGVPVRVHKANVEISVVEGSVTVNYACEGGLVPNGDVHHTTCSAGMWSDIGQLCVDVRECYVVVDGLAVYSGPRSYTESGYTCQRWDSQYPHEHDYVEELFPPTNGYDNETIESAANYYRDPGSDGFLWCYTTSSDERWQSCDIPHC